VDTAAITSNLVRLAVQAVAAEAVLVIQAEVARQTKVQAVVLQWQIILQQLLAVAVEEEQVPAVKQPLEPVTVVTAVLA
jgi:hypothetical protein